MSKFTVERLNGSIDNYQLAVRLNCPISRLKSEMQEELQLRSFRQNWMVSQTGYMNEKSSLLLIFEKIQVLDKIIIREMTPQPLIASAHFLDEMHDLQLLISVNLYARVDSIKQKLFDQKEILVEPRKQSWSCKGKPLLDKDYLLDQLGEFTPDTRILIDSLVEYRI